eukprot:4030831-Amphidinium_carterae.1
MAKHMHTDILMAKHADTLVLNRLRQRRLKTQRRMILGVPGCWPSPLLLLVCSTVSCIFPERSDVAMHPTLHGTAAARHVCVV